MTTHERLFGTSHFLGPDSDLWRFSEAAMHWDCYAKWEHRARFARMYFDSRSGRTLYWGVAHSDDQVKVTANPDKLVSEVRVILAETGSEFDVPLADWEDWLAGEWLDGCRHEVEREALAAVLPRLRSELPTADAVVAAADVGDEESQTAAAGDLGARISYELTCETLAARAVRKGLACPGCGCFSTDYEYVRIEPVSESGPQSHLVCRACGNEFGPYDV